MPVRIAAVVCTFNRARYLRRALKSLQAQDAPADGFEVLIVDNGSTDDTRDVALSFCTTKRFRYAFEPTIGLSRARNRAWYETPADYIAYIDDDAVASAAWLNNAAASFSRDSAVGCVGGRTTPVWEACRPRWLSDNLLMYLSCVDWSPAAHVLAPDQWLVGTNIAFRRDVLERVGGFREDLGRRGERLYSMEDIDVQRKVGALGLKCFYNPAMEVTHYIPAARATPGWFVRRCYFQGASRARMISAANESATAPAWITARLRAAAARSWRGGGFSLVCRTAELAGFLSGMAARWWQTVS
jgi:glucosyl-dolichyl phosphate glucuronosyltransferase